MRKFLPDTLLLAAAIFGSPVSYAGDDTPPLEELFRAEVEGASRYAQPIAEAPATATVITAEDIARYSHQTLGDALSMAPGVYTSNDYAYSLIGVRGFSRPGDYNSRVLLLVDGARSNDVVYDQAMLGTESAIDMGWVKRVEFVPGASSALYGGNALFGIANAILWSGADLNGTRISTKVGSEGRRGISLLSGRGLEAGGEWVAGLAVERSAGSDVFFKEFEVPGISDGVARGLDGQRSVKAFARYSDKGWRIGGGYAGRYKNVPTAYYGVTFGESGNYVRDQHANLDITHASEISSKWGQFARIHLGWDTFDAEYPYPGVRSRDELLASWWSGEYRLSYSGIEHHQMQFGVELRRNSRMNQKFLDVSPPADYLNDQRTSAATAAYFQDEWRLSRNWIANIGYRIDKVKDYEAIGSPRLALIYRPIAEVSAKLLYGRAFRAPNAYERFYNDGNISQKANPGLRPERIETTELALDYTVTPTLRLGAGHYVNHIHDLIEQTTDPADGLFVFNNRPSLTVSGWEMNTEALFGQGWRLQGSLSWQRPSEPRGVPTNAPAKLAKLFVDGPLPGRGWTLGFGLQAMSARQTSAGTTPGHAVGNLTLRQATEGPYGQWSINWRNVGNVSFADPGGPEHTQVTLPQPGRQWLIRWDFTL